MNDSSWADDMAEMRCMEHFDEFSLLVAWQVYWTGKSELFSGTGARPPFETGKVKTFSDSVARRGSEVGIFANLFCFATTKMLANIKGNQFAEVSW